MGSEEKGGNKVEEGGFKFKDRRSSVAEAFESEKSNNDYVRDERPQGKTGNQNSGDLPQDSNTNELLANFSTHVITLYEQASFYMGFIPNPEVQKPEVNLQISKMLIDTLAMLKEKTKGNLTEQESNLLEEAVYDLKMKYLSLIKKS